jgi:hypothetical protein
MLFVFFPEALPISMANRQIAENIARNKEMGIINILSANQTKIHDEIDGF